MKKPTIFFNPIEGSASLAMYWHEGPYGDAVEANNGIGVGFFSPFGELLGVIFDSVEEKKDYQVLAFPNHKIEVKVNKGKVSYALHITHPKKHAA